MSCLVELLFHVAIFTVVLGKKKNITIFYLGYPASQALKTVKEGTPSKLWITYFFILGIFTLLEGTVLLPIKLLLDLICTSVFPIIKALVCLWMIHPQYRGALFVDQIAQPHIEKYFGLVAKSAAKPLSFVGIPVRAAAKEEASS